jgi:hypothetical protein
MAEGHDLRLLSRTGPKCRGDQSQQSDGKWSHRGNDDDLTNGAKARIFNPDGVFGIHRTGPDRPGKSENVCHPLPARPPGLVRRRCAQDNPRIFATRLPSVRKQTFPGEAAAARPRRGAIRAKGRPGSPAATASGAGSGAHAHDIWRKRYQLVVVAGARFYGSSATGEAIGRRCPWRCSRPSYAYLGPVQSAFVKYIGGCFWS